MLATSRQLAASFFTQLAGGDSYVAVWRLPACGRAQHGSLPVGPRACRSVSRSQSRCAIARCYSEWPTANAALRDNFVSFERTLLFLTRTRTAKCQWPTANGALRDNFVSFV